MIDLTNTTPDLIIIDDSKSPSTQLMQESSQNASQNRSKCGKAWQAWENRALAKVTVACNPYTPHVMAQQGDERWDHIATTIAASNPLFNRTGNACKFQLLKLISMHKKNQTRSLMLTETDEEIMKYMITMDELIEIAEAASKNSEL